MTRLSRLALPGYAVCLWLLVFPLVDAGLVSLPMSPTVDVWRYSVVALFSRSLMTPCLGLFVALSLATALEHGQMQKWIMVLSSLAALAVVAATVVFLVDSVGLRGTERPGLFPPFGRVWTVAVLKLVFFVGVLSVITATARASNQGGEERGVIFGRAGND